MPIRPDGSQAGSYPGQEPVRGLLLPVLPSDLLHGQADLAGYEEGSAILMGDGYVECEAGRCSHPVTEGALAQEMLAGEGPYTEENYWIIWNGSIVVVLPKEVGETPRQAKDRALMFLAGEG